MKGANNYPSIVKNKPEPDFKHDEPICPFCQSKDVEVGDHCMTCVAGWDPKTGKMAEDFSDHDPNHHWISHVCKACKKRFCLEWKRGNGWYTDYHWKKGGPPRILAGAPSCFEHYVYTCSHCDGDVYEENREFDGTKTTCLRYENGVPQYRTFFVCNCCGAEEELCR
jgi:hypothetical protein